MDAYAVTIFGSLVSFLLAILTGIGVHMLRELRELRATVGNHAAQLASISTTLRHFERRGSLGNPDE